MTTQRIKACLLGGASAQGAADVEDGAELGRAERALAVVVAEGARVEAVPAHEVHRWQLQRAPAQRAPAVLEHPRLLAAIVSQHPVCTPKSREL